MANRRNMSTGNRILQWFGFGWSAEERNAKAQRNMFSIMFGGIAGALFSGMIAFCLITGISCPIGGIDEAVQENPAMAGRFRVFCVVATVFMLLFSFVAYTYRRRKWNRPRLAAVLTIAFSLVFVMIWGVADSGRSPGDQILIFASLQFLVAGLLIFGPIDAIVYFGGSFFLFGYMLNWSGLMAPGDIGNLVYLALLDIVVSWIVYSLFRGGVHREAAIADVSRRDELTGAKNRHYLRDDFDNIIGSQHFVMLCDIDDFKHYNDDMNHETGDTLLREFFFALREVFGDECTYRYGGDEFLVVSPDFDEAEFLQKIERCNDQLKHVMVNGENANLTFSGGYTYGVPRRGEDFRDMLHSADEELLAVKHSGKKRVSGHAFAA
ncbi:MAG: diguanylate cyclase [Eggerthellaceae bacterium]|nr:diguanylate cyclase [Eggerthellaceae bacterium]